MARQLSKSMADAAVASFCEVTGADPATARQFIDMAGGSIDQAVELYFQSPAPAPAPRPAPAPSTRPAPAPSTRPAPAPSSRPAHAPSTRPGPKPGDTKALVDDILHHAEAQQQGPPETFALGDDKLEKVRVTFWKNGFQIDDGDFRSNDDPANQEFLQSVSRGMVPRELYKPGVQIDVEIEDNREKDYKPKPKPRDPFAGAGHSLGGPSRPAPAPAPSPSAAPSKPVKTDFSVAGQPSTKVRVQMPDGQNVTFTVGMSATVGDLKKYVIQNRPGLSRVTLAVAFPPRDLTDDKVTVEQAGLKMASLIVKA